MNNKLDNIKTPQGYTRKYCGNVIRDDLVLDINKSKVKWRKVTSAELNFPCVQFLGGVARFEGNQAGENKL
jgi:hypothetical protein